MAVRQRYEVRVMLWGPRDLEAFIDLRAIFSLILAVSYVRSRWLTRLARGVFCRALGELLEKCRNAKTVRLCLMFGKEFSHPWFSKLNLKTLPRGSASTWVARSRTGTLVLKQ